MGYHSKFVHNLFCDSFIKSDLPNTEIKETFNINRPKFTLYRKDFVKNVKYFFFIDWVNDYFYCIPKNFLHINVYKTSIESKHAINKAIFITNNITILKKYYDSEIK